MKNINTISIYVAKFYQLHAAQRQSLLPLSNQEERILFRTHFDLIKIKIISSILKFTMIFSTIYVLKYTCKFTSNKMTDEHYFPTETNFGWPIVRQ